MSGGCRANGRGKLLEAGRAPSANYGLKGTQVDGVYDSDPKLNKDAKLLKKISFHQVLSQDLKVMDASAISLARENNIPIMVFSIHKPGGFREVLSGGGDCTVISG